MSIYMTDLARVLASAGLTVVEVPGWKTRGTDYRGGQTAVKGGIAHHTATRDTYRGDMPTLKWLIDGGTNLPGPVANLGLGRSGTWYVIAAGRANHAGPVHARFRDEYANGRSIGIEAEHQGTYPEWPEAQYDAYIRGIAALEQHYRVTFRPHKEVRPGKVDPSFPWGPFRAAVDAAKAPRPVTKWITPEGDDPAYLREGHEHAKVAEIQAWIIDKYGWARDVLAPNGGADGKFGPAMSTVVGLFQSRLNTQAARDGWRGWTPLAVDSKWGPATEAAAKGKSGFRKKAAAPAPKVKTTPIVPFPTGGAGSIEYGLGLEAFARACGFSINCGPTDQLAGRCTREKHPHGPTSEHFAVEDGRKGWALDLGRNPASGATVSRYEIAMLSSFCHLVLDLSGGALEDRVVLNRATGDHEDHAHLQGHRLRTKKDHFRPDYRGVPDGWLVYGHGSPALSGGDRADEVKALQRALGIKVDGSFRLDTWHALREAQAKAGINVDGIAGKATFGALGVTR